MTSKSAGVQRTVPHNSHQQQESLLRLWSTLAGLKWPADVGLFNSGSREPKLWRLILCPLSTTSNYCIHNRCRERTKDKNLKTKNQRQVSDWPGSVADIIAPKKKQSLRLKVMSYIRRVRPYRMPLQFNITNSCISNTTNHILFLWFSPLTTINQKHAQRLPGCPCVSHMSSFSQ